MGVALRCGIMKRGWEAARSERAERGNLIRASSTGHFTWNQNQPANWPNINRNINTNGKLNFNDKTNHSGQLSRVHGQHDSHKHQVKRVLGEGPGRGT